MATARRALLACKLHQKGKFSTIYWRVHKSRNTDQIHNIQLIEYKEFRAIT